MNKTEQLVNKQKELDKLAKILEISLSGIISDEIKPEITELKDRMEIRIKDLMDDYRILEVDIKLEIFQQLIDLIKNG